LDGRDLTHWFTSTAETATGTACGAVVLGGRYVVSRTGGILFAVGERMRVYAALLVAVVAVATACDPEGNAAPFIAGATSGCLIPFRVNPGTATRHPGDTLQVQAVSVCDINFDPTQVRWSTSDTIVARVDSLTGLVLARANGIVTVKAVEVADRTVSGAMVLSVVP
jgi:hypothetical protein